MFGSVKCFKYFLLNGFKLDDNSMGCAILGGEAEIIHNIEQNGFKVKNIDINIRFLDIRETFLTGFWRRYLTVCIAIF